MKVYYLNISALCILLLGVVLTSCREDFTYDSATAKLGVSEDTVFLDTVFNDVRTRTHFLKIYNREDKDIAINRIYLENGSNSFYKINVDGSPGNSFSNVPLRKNDSIYVFIELAVTGKANESVVQENLFIETQNTQQKVVLFSVAEDVEFFKPPAGSSTYKIESNTVWTKNKPKLIFENVLVTNNAQLTIEKGTKIYFHRKGKLLMDENTKLVINGTKSEEVIFRGDRHETSYDTLYGNWQQIELRKKAIATINYAKIQGGTYGIITQEQTDITLENTKFFNFEKVGLSATNAKITGKNVVFNNCKEADFVALSGTYTFLHSTFAGYFLNQAPKSVVLSNTYSDGTTSIDADLNALFGNCIFYGYDKESLSLTFKPAAAANYQFDRCLIRTQNTTDPKFINCIFNVEPKFKSTWMSKNLLSILAGSPAIGIGNLSIANQVPLDIQEISRTVNPNLGAYQ